MQIRLLGPLEVASGRDVARLGSPKQRATLAILVMHVGEIVSTDRLTDLLWDDRAPRTAAHSLQIYVSELRRALLPLRSEGALVTQPPGYRLDVARGSIDLFAFEDLVRAGLDARDAGHRPRAANLLYRALALWRGPALSDFRYEGFAQETINRLDELRLDALEALAQIELDDGGLADALTYATRALREDPLREQARELSMLALYRLGRAADALRAFEEGRRVLAEELGLAPSPSLEGLADRIRRRDPTLLAVDDARAGGSDGLDSGAPNAVRVPDPASLRVVQLP